MRMRSSDNNVQHSLELDLEELPLDVFELAELGLTLESLTAGHGMPDDAASAYTNFCLCSCSQCSS